MVSYTPDAVCQRAGIRFRVDAVAIADRGSEETAVDTAVLDVYAVAVAVADEDSVALGVLDLQAVVGGAGYRCPCRRAGGVHFEAVAIRSIDTYAFKACPADEIAAAFSVGDLVAVVEQAVGCAAAGSTRGFNQNAILGTGSDFNTCQRCTGDPNTVQTG